MSTGDFQEACCPLGQGRTEPVVGRNLAADGGVASGFDAWQKRDLSARRYVYVWADGIYLQARMEDNAECMLVLIGATPDGKKELVGFQTGVRESGQSWRELLIDIKQRGLEIVPDLAVGDGALGFWKAIEEVSPTTGSRRKSCEELPDRNRWFVDMPLFHFRSIYWRCATYKCSSVRSDSSTILSSS